MAFKTLSGVGVGRARCPPFLLPHLGELDWCISLGISFSSVLRIFPVMCARVIRPKNTRRHSSGANMGREVILMWDVDEQAGYLNYGSILRICTPAM